MITKLTNNYVIHLQLLQSTYSRWLIKLSLLRKKLRSLCLALVIFKITSSEEHEGEMASCLHSLLKAF
jgi:hypothetical protein